MIRYLARIQTPLLLLPIILTVNGAAQEKSNAKPQIGDAAPEWKALTGTDGKQHSLSDLSAANVVVLCFTCNTCPYSIDYEDRLIALAKKYAATDETVKLVAINSNGVPVDSLENMKKRAMEKEFNFDYLKDETQEVAREYGAIYTPEFYVLNRDRTIVYRGAMDDSTKAQGVKVKYVELAIDAALSGKQPEVTTTGARGCTIRFKRKRR